MERPVALVVDRDPAVRSLINGVFEERGFLALGAENAACKEAALQVGIEIYQARTSVGGQIVAVYFTPGPYRLSVWLILRVYALIGPYMNPAGMVG